MRILLATAGFSHPGGSEMYVLVVAEQLERLGHDVVIRSAERGPMAEEAQRRGLRVVDEPPQAPDVVLVQDAPSAHELAAAWPAVPQVFRACSDVFDFQLPPAGVAAVVVVSERVAARVRGLAAPPKRLVRLRHPVDVRRFAPLRPIASRPRRALLLGNYLAGPRLEALTTAWEAAGVECVRTGWPGDATLAPELAINAADIVVGKARVVLEAMACGRAAYVYDVAGRDGWVTAGTYAAMEADGFAGHATGAGINADALATELEDYDAGMGDVNRDLAVRHHHAARHAEALVALFREVIGAPVPAPDSAAELARLTRRLRAAEGDAALLRATLDQVERRFAPARAELEALYADRAIVAAHRDDARAEVERLRAQLAAPRRRLRGRA